MAVSFEAFTPGASFDSPERLVDDAMIRDAVRLGGYTHPLFTDPAYAARSALGARPLPGEAVLLLMGGLAEQTERFGEDVIALTGFDDVRFHRPVVAGDVVKLRVEVAERTEPEPGRGAVAMRWTFARADGTVVCTAIARMLFAR
ncbi:MAG: MaoC family dehydratase [Actinomycetota bacterium]